MTVTTGFEEPDYPRHWGPCQEVEMFMDDDATIVRILESILNQNRYAIFEKDKMVTESDITKHNVKDWVQ